MAKKLRTEPVDDYDGARFPRLRDVHSLNEAGRYIGAWHLGGMALECLIKAGIVHSLGLTHWRDDTHPTNPRNPKHILMDGIKELPTQIQLALLSDPSFITDLATVQTPPGPNFAYVALRYCGQSPTDADHQKWLAAYRRVLRAIHKAFHKYLTGWR
ncbi:hypothetical protein [Archangium sp.]|uniref:hypothetical protein n=1 Tax=Archangium sp. TaxID=1872627 RepID=UPI002D337F5F|nr:hypothetical protein [Archangium sp.]HYO51286.1 hypothetical protein [Archangium sp.]